MKLKKVKLYTFSRIIEGDKVIDPMFNVKHVGERVINTGYITEITRVSSPEAVLFLVTMDKQANPLHSPFYIDYESYNFLFL